MRETKITNFNVNWGSIRDACMTTISKDGQGKQPTQEWKRKLLLCQHSPIRRGSVSWKWEEIPYYVSTHMVRHHAGCEKFISTSRADRTGVDRSERAQTDPVCMEMDANIQSILDISRKRLCTAADKETLLYWKSFLEQLKTYDEDIYWASVPECVRCGGCPEYTNCGFYDNLMRDVPSEDQKSLVRRYDIYNSRRK